MAIASIGIEPIIWRVELEPLGKEINGLFVFLLLEKVDGHLVVGERSLLFELDRFLLILEVGICDLETLQRKFVLLLRSVKERFEDKQVRVVQVHL